MVSYGFRRPCGFAEVILRPASTFSRAAVCAMLFMLAAARMLDALMLAAARMLDSLHARCRSDARCSHARCRSDARCSHARGRSDARCSHARCRSDARFSSCSLPLGCSILFMLAAVCAELPRRPKPHLGRAFLACCRSAPLPGRISRAKLFMLATVFTSILVARSHI